MASLMHLLETEKIESGRTERLYFGKYSYRISLHVTLLDEIEKERRKAAKKNLPVDNDLSEYLLSLISTPDNGRVFSIRKKVLETFSNVKMRGEWKDILRLYIENEQDAITAVDLFRPLVVDVKCPQNETQATLLREDHKVIIRKSLFWGRYRWRVDIHWRYRDGVIRNWCDETFAFDRCRWNERAMVSDYPLCIFLKNESDVFLIKMAFSDSIQKISRVVLPEETS
jgi:hypothetical protein